MVMVTLILLVWRIVFGVTGLEMPVRCRWFDTVIRCDAGSLWLAIISKSKDRFMERPTMKTIQP
jgi:hypothetical protein